MPSSSPAWGGIRRGSVPLTAVTPRGRAGPASERSRLRGALMAAGLRGRAPAPPSRRRHPALCACAALPCAPGRRCYGNRVGPWPGREPEQPGRALPRRAAGGRGRLGVPPAALGVGEAVPVGWRRGWSRAAGPRVREAARPCQAAAHGGRWAGQRGNPVSPHSSSAAVPSTPALGSVPRSAGGLQVARGPSLVPTRPVGCAQTPASTLRLCQSSTHLVRAHGVRRRAWRWCRLRCVSARLLHTGTWLSW